MDTNSRTIKKIRKNLANAEEINPEDVVDKKINDDEDDDEDMEPPQELVDEVKKFLQVDDACRKMQEKLKEYKNARKKIDDKILKLLEKYGEQQITVADGKLIKNQYKSKGSLTDELLNQTFKEEGFNEEKIKRIMERINNKKEMNSKHRVQLKRTYNKG